MDVREITLHRRRLVYRTAGDDGGAPLLMIHGITQDSTTWERVAEHLGHDASIVAPDLPGHGGSESPEGDHSLGAYASNLRDLLVALDQPSVTVVGHSLGGGVALQFAYQFPEMVDRLVLIDSGGLGHDVSPVLRAAALPGADTFLALATTDAVASMAGSLAKFLSRLGLQAGTDLREMARGVSGLADPEERRAFLRTVQAVIGLTGQSVSAKDKLYLAAEVPTLIVWGVNDRIIPLRHATLAHQEIENSFLRVVEHAGHFPHLDEPGQVADLVRDFLEGTEAVDMAREEWGEIIRSNGSRS
jgi:pimeloyl-ACP methyl ester carboxylesterase